MNDAVRRAAEVLRAGGLVAFPTETVYGLGADASSPKAVARLYAVKLRPKDHPVIVHFGDTAAAFAWAREVPDAAWALATRFWPGPLTLILKRSVLAGDCVTGGQDSVGLRVPSHPVAQELLREFGGGVAAPSANRFGRISPTTAAHVRADLGVEVDLVLEGGASEVGIESTIVDLSGEEPMLLRPGHIGAKEIAAVIGREPGAKRTGAPRHSGGLERHYAPRTPLRVVATYALDAEIERRSGRVALLAFARADTRVARWIRMPREPVAYARRLYGALRELDAAGCEAILVEMPPEAQEWTAVLDRLRRAEGLGVA